MKQRVLLLLFPGVWLILNFIPLRAENDSFWENAFEACRQHVLEMDYGWIKTTNALIEGDNFYYLCLLLQIFSRFPFIF